MQYVLTYFSLISDGLGGVKPVSDFRRSEWSVLFISVAVLGISNVKCDFRLA